MAPMLSDVSDTLGCFLMTRMLSDQLRYFLTLSLSILSNFVTFVVTIEASKKMSALLSTKLLYLIYYTDYVTTDTR